MSPIELSWTAKKVRIGSHSICPVQQILTTAPFSLTLEVESLCNPMYNVFVIGLALDFVVNIKPDWLFWFNSCKAEKAKRQKYVRNIPPDLKRTIQIIWSETFHTNLEKLMTKEFHPQPADSAVASIAWSACPPYWTSFKNDRSAAFGGFALARLFILVRLDRPNIA